MNYICSRYLFFTIIFFLYGRLNSADSPTSSALSPVSAYTPEPLQLLPLEEQFKSWLYDSNDGGLGVPYFVSGPLVLCAPEAQKICVHSSTDCSADTVKSDRAECKKSKQKVYLHHVQNKPVLSMPQTRTLGYLTLKMVQSAIRTHYRCGICTHSFAACAEYEKHKKKCQLKKR